MAFGRIDFEHEPLKRKLTGVEEFAAALTRKELIKLDARCEPDGVSTIVGINSLLLERVTPGEQIEIEMALDALVKALDSAFTDNDDVLKWLFSIPAPHKNNGGYQE